MTTRSARTRGFTIVEVMFAAAVMALAITTSITAMHRGFSSLDTARNLTVAGQIMQCEMEKLRMKAWPVVSAFPTTETVEPVDSSFTSNPSIGNRFTLRRQVAVVTTTPGAALRRITFTVSWKGFDGRTVSRSYTTEYGQNGLYDYYFNSF